MRTAESWAFPQREVRVALDLEAAGRARRHARPGDAGGAERERRRCPAARSTSGPRSFNLKTSGGYADARAGRATPWSARGDGRVVRVRDVADGALGAEGGALHRALQRQARRVRDARTRRTASNIFDGARRASTARRRASRPHCRPASRLERGFDQSRNVEHRLTRLGIDFALAIALVLLTLLPLGLRAPPAS